MVGKVFSLLAFKRGSFIAQTGAESSDSFFVIHSGSVQLTCDVEIVQGKTDIVLGAGHFFAIVSGLCSKPHFESAVALSDVTIIAVRKDKFIDFIRQYQKNALKIIQYLSGRMRFLDEILTSNGTIEVKEKNPEALFEIAEFYNNDKQYKIAYYIYHRFLDYFQTGKKADHAKRMERKLEKYSEGVRFSYSKKNLYRFYPKGTMLFAENETGNELFVIRDGHVNITKIVDGVEKKIATLHSDDIIGEMSLIEGLPRSANAIAAEDCDVLAIVQEDFPQLIQSDPAVAMKISIALADRIWDTHIKILNSGSYKAPL